MYALLHECILVQRHTRRQPRDPVIYAARHPLTGERIFTHDAAAPHATRYGSSYHDHQGTLCIIPDVWDNRDARQAKDTLF